MAEITIETASQAVTKAANTAVVVKDARGREIGIKRLGVLERMRLYELVGGENCKNDHYFGLAVLAYSVVSIDGDQLVRPGTKRELEALVQRLDDDGLNAVGKFFVDSASSEPSVDEVKTAVKNG